MDDAKYLFVTDVADKKNIARSSHNKVYSGPGGRFLGLRQENMTDKELDRPARDKIREAALAKQQGKQAD